MVEVNRLIGLKAQAQKNSWADLIRTAADEKALLEGYTFSWDHYDLFRYYIEKLTLADGQYEGQNLELLDYQHLICGSLFGWIDPQTGYRRFRKGFIELPKKNGKSTLIAALGLYMFEGDGEAGAQVYNMANDRDQAGLLWKIAADMVEANSEMEARIKVIRSTKTMVSEATNSVFKAWSSDQSSKDGPNIHCAIIDELHEWKGKSALDFWNKIYYGGRVRRQPLCPLVITTAGDDLNSLCYAQHTYAQQILDGRADSDLKYFALVYGVDHEKMKADPDYWKNPEAWKESNPAYGKIIKHEVFEEDIKEAEKNPVSKQAFLRYVLNYWTEDAANWISVADWDASASHRFEESQLDGTICFGGIDLSSSNDLTAVVYCFPYMDGETKKYRVIARVYCPQDKIQERLDHNINFLHWVEQGFIRATPGNVIDYQTILNDIEADAARFQIKEFGYDRHAATWLVQQLQEKLPNIALFPVNQSITVFSNPTKALYVSIQNKLIEHNFNPVLKWAIGNAIPWEDSNGNIALHKGRSRDKIDPVIGLILAHNQAHLGTLEIKKKFSIYGSSDFAEKIKRLEGIDI